MTADVGLQSLIRAASGGDRPPRGFLTRFAERIGVSTSTVSRWREGTVPDAEWWPKLADALGLSEAEVRQAATSARLGARTRWPTFAPGSTESSHDLPRSTGT